MRRVAAGPVRFRARTRFSAAASCLLGVIAAQGAAADEPLRKALRACAALAAEAERLACYDETVARLATDSAAAAPPRSPEERFGLRERSSPEERGELTRMTARVRAVYPRDDGSLRIELDNGQVWEQIDAEVKLVLAPGDAVTISRAAFGSFRLATLSNRFARVKRVR